MRVFVFSENECIFISYIDPLSDILSQFDL